jgi:hypothetical protein
MADGIDLDALAEYLNSDLAPEDCMELSDLDPLRRRLMALNWVNRLRERVGRLNRYSALVLLLVPWLILEPIKPIGFLLFTHKHHFAATILIVGGEVVKLTLNDAQRNSCHRISSRNACEGMDG